MIDGKLEPHLYENVELSAPYMHNGQLSTLKDVVEFYNQGGTREVGKMKNETISPLIFPLNLTENEVNDVVEFLKTSNRYKHGYSCIRWLCRTCW